MDSDDRPDSFSVSRRALITLLGASGLAWLWPSHDASRLAAAHVSRALELDALASLETRVASDAELSLAQLLTRISGLTPEGILALSPHALRERLRSLIVADYAAGRIERVGGWWLSATEAGSVALARRVRRLPSG
jgi:hypothetical protein